MSGLSDSHSNTSNEKDENSDLEKAKERIRTIPERGSWNESREFQDGFKGFSDTYGIPDSEACQILEDILSNPVCEKEGIRKQVFNLFSTFQSRMRALQDRMKDHKSYQWYRDHTIRTFKEGAKSIDQQIRNLNLDEVRENAYFVSNVAHIMISSILEDE